MDSSHMKSFKNMLLEVAERVSDFSQEMKESNVRTNKSHQETKNQESFIEDFIVPNIKTKTVHINATWHDHFARVHKSLKNSYVYKPIVINDLIHANNRSNFMKIIINTYWMRSYHLISVSFQFTVLIYPSSGPHLVVDFLSKQPVADASCAAAQFKLIYDRKSQSKLPILVQ